MGETERPSGEVTELDYEYREEQKKILDRLKVGDLKDTLPERLLEIYQENQDIAGEKILKKKKSEVLITADNNGIFTIRELKRVGRFWPLPPRFHVVKNFYYVDSVSKKAWDASQMWKAFEKEHYSDSSDERKKDFRLYQIYRKGGSESSAFGYSLRSKVGSLLFNRFQEHPGIKKKKFPTSRVFRSLDHTAPSHEVAHFTQLDPELFTRSKWEMIKMNLQWDFYTTIVKSKFVTKVASLVPGIKKGLESFRQNKVEKERNANAFSLATIRRLKKQGLDVFRGIPNRDVVLAVNHALQTYDWAFAAVEGSKFSKLKYDLISEEGRKSAYSKEQLMEEFGGFGKQAIPEPV